MTVTTPNLARRHRKDANCSFAPSQMRRATSCDWTAAECRFIDSFRRFCWTRCRSTLCKFSATACVADTVYSGHLSSCPEQERRYFCGVGDGGKQWVLLCFLHLLSLVQHYFFANRQALVNRRARQNQLNHGTVKSLQVCDWRGIHWFIAKKL